MVVTAYYNNGKSAKVTNYTTNPQEGTPVTIDLAQVVVSYTEGGITKTAALRFTNEPGGGDIIVTPKPEEKLYVNIREYTQEQEGLVVYLTNIQPNTHGSDMVQHIETNGTIKLYDKDDIQRGLYDEPYTMITTGMKLKIEKGEDYKQYTIVVRGDTNGDSKANFTDMLVINKHRLGKRMLEGAYKKAGDINGDGLANFTDMLKINKYRLKKIEEL